MFNRRAAGVRAQQRNGDPPVLSSSAKLLTHATLFTDVMRRSGSSGRREGEMNVA